MLAATALVLLMTPALGLFYAGLVRAKNSLNTFMMCVAAIAIAGVTWALIGYSLAFDGEAAADRRARQLRAQRRRLRAARRRDDPAAAVHGLPGDLLHHHRRPDLRRRGRADAVRRLHGLRRALVGRRLRRARPLGLRRRLARRAGHARLRRRRPGRDGLRLLGARRGARGRRAQRLRPPGAPPPQRRLRAGRRRPALVRLVRLQRRQRHRRPASRACSPSSTRC